MKKVVLELKYTSLTKRQVDFSEFFLGVFMYLEEAVVHYKAKKNEQG